MIIKDDIIFGLTPEEVEDRIKKGQVNKKENRKYLKSNHMKKDRIPTMKH